jgi:hypothetical protein
VGCGESSSQSLPPRAFEERERQVTPACTQNRLDAYPVHTGAGHPAKDLPACICSKMRDSDAGWVYLVSRNRTIAMSHHSESRGA